MRLTVQEPSDLKKKHRNYEIIENNINVRHIKNKFKRRIEYLKKFVNK